MDPYRVIWTARSLSPENNRLFTGPARTVRPTADGMAIRRENRIAAATFFFTMAPVPGGHSPGHRRDQRRGQGIGDSHGNVDQKMVFSRVYAPLGDKLLLHAQALEIIGQETIVQDAVDIIMAELTTTGTTVKNRILVMVL